MFLARVLRRVFSADASRVRCIQEALDGARAEAVALRAQIAAQAAAQAAAPAEGGWAGALDADASTEEGVREGDAAEGGAGRENEAPGEVAGAEADGAPDARAPAAGREDAPAHGRKARPRAPGDARLKRQHARRWPPGGGDAEDAAAREAAGVDEPDEARDRAAETTTEASEESTGASSDAPVERSEDRFAV
jgi:hypothetical protein